LWLSLNWLSVGELSGECQRKNLVREKLLLILMNRPVSIDGMLYLFDMVLGFLKTQKVKTWAGVGLVWHGSEFCKKSGKCQNFTPTGEWSP